MAEEKNKSDLNAMDLQERGVSEGGYLKTPLVAIASAVERIVLGFLRPIYTAENFLHGSGKTGSRTHIDGSVLVNFVV